MIGILLINFEFFLLLSNDRRDNVVWDEQQEQQAKDNVVKNSSVTLTEDQLLKYDDEADKYWNSFYDIHQNK